MALPAYLFDSTMRPTRLPCCCALPCPGLSSWCCRQVSAKTEEDDVVQGLRCGADDYITKPFKRAELAARIRAHIRARDAFAQQQAVEQAWLLQHNLLPPNVQRKLRAGETVIAESHPAVTVLWAEVVGGLAGSTPAAVQQQQQQQQVLLSSAPAATAEGADDGGLLTFRRASGGLSPAEAVVTLNSLYTTWEELCAQRVSRGGRWGQLVWCCEQGWAVGAAGVLLCMAAWRQRWCVARLVGFCGVRVVRLCTGLTASITDSAD